MNDGLLKSKLRISKKEKVVGKKSNHSSACEKSNDLLKPTKGSIPTVPVYTLTPPDGAGNERTQESEAK